MSTAQNIIDKSEARLRDEYKTQWGDDELLIYLNKGYSYVQNILSTHNNELGIESATIVTVAGTAEYLLDTVLPDFMNMSKDNSNDKTTGVSITDDDSIFFLTPTRYDKAQKDTTGATEVRPTEYYLSASHIGFVATPDAAYNIVCRYYATTTDLVLGDAMPYNGLFDAAIEQYMTTFALSRAGFITVGSAAIYNDLEKMALSISGHRSPVRFGLKKRTK